MPDPLAASTAAGTALTITALVGAIAGAGLNRLKRVACWRKPPLFAALVLAEAAFAAPLCSQSVPDVLIERVMSATCEACWREAAAAPDANALVLDWIAPAGDDAAMALVAQPDALKRATPAADTTTVRRSVLPQRRRPALDVGSGLPVNGYIGLRLTVFRHAALPPGTEAFLVLTQRLPAGAEGSPIARQVVHGVAGPLSLVGLAGRRELVLRFVMRLPPTAEPEQLAAAGWLQTPQGEVIAAAQSPEASDSGCAPPQSPWPPPVKPRP